jgi:hypothetical protein
VPDQVDQVEGAVVNGYMKKFTVLFALLGVFISCELPLMDVNGGEWYSRGSEFDDRVSITLSYDERFTIKEYSPLQEINSIVLEASRSGYDAVVESIQVSEPTGQNTIDLYGLDEGVWRFSASALNENGDLLFSGFTDFEVHRDQADLVITMVPEIGILELPLEWPATGLISDVRVSA